MRIGTKPSERRKGTALVETAIILSLLFLLVFGIFEYARFVMARNIYANAAREGARFAVVHTYDKTDQDIRDEVMKYLAGQGVQLENFDPAVNILIFRTDASGNMVMSGSQPASWTDARFGEGIAVEIQGVYRPNLPIFLHMGTTVNIRERATMYSEAN